MLHLFKPQKLEAFTIIESMVAMVLILLSFGVAILSFQQINEGDRILESNRVAEIVNNQMNHFLRERKQIAEVFEKGGITVISSAVPLDNQIQLFVQAKNSLGLTLYELSTYVSAHEWNQ